MNFRMKMKIDAFFGIMFWLFFTVAVVGGWGLNLYKFTKADFREPYKTEVIRCIGLIPPIGAIVGWMDIGEEEEENP